MRMIIDKLKCEGSKIVKLSFIIFEIILSRLFSNRRMKILFSNQTADWERNISTSFRFTRHEIAFGELSPENITNYDLVVPFKVSELKHLAGLRHLIVDNPIPIPSIDSLELCNDKYLFNKTLIENGFGTYIPKISITLPFPYLLKWRYGGFGENIHIITNSQQEKNFLDLLSHPEYFCQEFIPGPNEYATHILFKDQKIVRSINIQYVFKNEFPIKGKDNSLYTILCQCPYHELFSTILNFIKFEGLCCVNYKVVENQPFILEINPRFGGSLCRYFFSLIRYLD